MSDDVERIAVANGGDLGVTAIEVTRFDDHGDSVFELRGLDANERELAAVRLRQGIVDDLPNNAGFGSELTISVAGHDSRAVTRELNRIDIDGVFEDPTSQRFLALAEVSSALAGAHVITSAPVVSDEIAFETYYVHDATCRASSVLTTPLAKGCCEGWFAGAGSQGSGTRFINPSNQIVKRVMNPQGTGCKASDGVSSCSGQACYYGPLGFATPVLSSGSNPVIWRGELYIAKLDQVNTYCDGSFQPSPSQSDYPDVTGTAPRNQGCPGGNQGNGFWDY